MGPKETQHFAVGQVVKEAWVCIIYVLCPPRIKRLDRTGKNKPLSLLLSPVFHTLKSNKLIHIVLRLAQAGASLQARAREAGTSCLAVVQ